MLFRAYGLSIVLSWFCASSFYVPWDNGYNIEPAVPRDVIVHVINDLGLALLEAHNENNINNIALSPYGAASVLIALSEGVQGEAFEEIKHVLHHPSDTSVVRVGLRDIHRHLKSYFIPKEGFLAGLTLSRDNITIKPAFEEILKFYGYDIETFNNPLYPDPYTTTTISSLPAKETDFISTTLETTQLTKEYMEEDISEFSETSTLAQNFSENLEINSTNFKETTTSLPSSMDFTNNDIFESHLSESKSTTLAISTVKDTESTFIANKETTNINKQRPTESTVSRTTAVPIQSTNATTSSTPTVTVDTQRTTYSTLSVTSTVTKKTSKSIPTTLMPTTMEETNKTDQNINLDVPLNTTTEFFSTENITEESTIENRQETTEALSSEQSKNISTTNIAQLGTQKESTTQTEIPDTTEYVSYSSTTESSTQTTDLNTETSTFTTTTDYASTVTENLLPNRTKRSVIDYVIARYYDNYHVNNNQNHNKEISYEPEKHFSFLVNGKIRENNINFMTYDTVLPFAFVPDLNCLALGFPLDNIKYYLLLLLPVEDDGINKLIFDLKQAGNLKEIIDSLKYSRVKASIPSFMLKGYVVLTPTLQKLGIRKIFEPRQADFSPMTNDRGTYVTNIEQAVTVTIRNYVDPNTLLQNYRYLHQYGTVEFKADHPFLYFVIDSDIHVTLMAGKIVNPLNSRVR